MPGQKTIDVSQLQDETRVGSMSPPSAIARVPLFTADRDMWLNQAWFRGPTESDGETYTLYKVGPGVAMNDAAEVALTDAVEVHSSNASWAANTKFDWTIDTDNNFIPAGTLVYVESSTTFGNGASINWRTTTRRQ